MRLLFHGTKDTNPELIFSGEYSLDSRLAKNGLYGKGIYFADNSYYSTKFHYQLPGQPGQPAKY